MALPETPAPRGGPVGMTQAQPRGPGAPPEAGRSPPPAPDPTRRAGWILILVGTVLLLILLLLVFL